MFDSVAAVEFDHPITMAGYKQTPATWGLCSISGKANIASKTYEFQNTGAGIKIFVLDTPIQLNHQELAGRVQVGTSFVEPPEANCSFHGTNSATIVAGKIVGVAKEATIISIPIISCTSNVDNVDSTSNLLQGLTWIKANVQNTSAVILIPLSVPRSSAVDSIVYDLLQTGFTVVSAAGNNNLDACTISPSRLQGLFVVGAYTHNSNVAYFSNWGRCVSLYAPGVDILAGCYQPQNGYSSVTGTSAAAAFVAGVAAQILQNNPSYKGMDVYNSLILLARQNELGTAGLFGAPNLVLQLHLTPNDAYTDYSFGSINVSGIVSLQITGSNKDFIDNGVDPRYNNIILLSLRYGLVGAFLIAAFGYSFWLYKYYVLSSKVNID